MRARACLLAALLSALACSKATSNEPDAAPPIDAAESPDVPEPPDAAVVPDGPPAPIDAHVPIDATPAPDAHVTIDAHPAIAAHPAVDAHPPADAGSGCDFEGWQLVQTSSSATFTFPAGSTVAAGGTQVLGRDSTESTFTTFWIVTVPTGGRYVDSAGALPLINGGETYELKDPAGTSIDGPTIAMPSTALKSLQRNSLGAAGTAANWDTVDDTSATPFATALPTTGSAPVISEFSDATGTGMYVNEFVEILCP